MPLWTFRDYVNRRGDNEIHEWLNSRHVPKKAKAAINARLVTLRGFPEFPENYVSAYKGRPGLFELKIRYAGAQYRPFGFYGPGRQEFTLLIGAIEKDGTIAPSLLDSAEKKREIVNNDTSRAIPHDFS